MDSSQAETWGYLTLVLLRGKSGSFNAAYQTMNEAFKLGLSDLSILCDITYLNLINLQYKAGRESLQYEMLTQVGPKGQKRLSTMFD